jgi:hypothetical protein
MEMDNVPSDEEELVEDFRVAKEKKRLYVEAREKTRPENPHLIHGHGKGSRISTNLTQHIMKTRMRDSKKSSDPREAILKYAEEAEKDPYWVAPAYKKAGQKLADRVYMDETEAAQEEKRTRRKCIFGLKLKYIIVLYILSLYVFRSFLSCR